MELIAPILFVLLIITLTLIGALSPEDNNTGKSVPTRKTPLQKVSKQSNIKYSIDISGKRNVTEEKLVWLFVEEYGLEKIEEEKNKNENIKFTIIGSRHTTRQYHHRKYTVPYTALEVVVNYNELMTIYNSNLSKQYERNKLNSKMRLMVKQRDNYTCRYCGKVMLDGVGLQIDHILPIAKGGKTELDNLQVLCSVCNRKKSDKIVPMTETVSTTETVSVEEEKAEPKTEPKTEPLNKRMTDEEYAKFMQETRDFIRRNK